MTPLDRTAVPQAVWKGLLLAIVQSIQSLDGEDAVINVEVDTPREGSGGDFYGATRDAPVQKLTRLQRDVFTRVSQT
jgi:hypothetical protein